MLRGGGQVSGGGWQGERPPAIDRGRAPLGDGWSGRSRGAAPPDRTRRSSTTERASELHRLFMLAEHVFERAIDLAERGVRANGLHDGGHEVAGAARFVAEATQGAARGPVV